MNVINRLYIQYSYIHSCCFQLIHFSTLSSCFHFHFHSESADKYKIVIDSFRFFIPLWSFWYRNSYCSLQFRSTKLLLNPYDSYIHSHHNERSLIYRNIFNRKHTTDDCCRKVFFISRLLFMQCNIVATNYNLQSSLQILITARAFWNICVSIKYKLLIENKIDKLIK